MSVKNVGIGETAWVPAVNKKTPLTPEVSDTKDAEGKPGSDNPSREEREFSERKQSETHDPLYSADGKLDPPPPSTLDVDA
ncbi:MAG: hypothetical protein ACRBDL_07600 [Alphaproteobacteria bacterium]